MIAINLRRLVSKKTNLFSSTFKHHFSTKDINPLEKIDQLLNASWQANMDGNITVAEDTLREAIVVQTSHLGPLHEDVLLSKNNLGASLLNQDRTTEAEPILRQTLHDRIEVLGGDHPQTLTSANNLALVLTHQGKITEAEPISKQAFVGTLSVKGPTDGDTLDCARNYGELLANVGKLEESQSLFNQFHLQCEREFGKEDPKTIFFKANEEMVRQAILKKD